MKIPFIKMHGIGNDFVVLDALSTPLPDGFDFAHAAQTLCARHFGIGGDGLLLLDTSTLAPLAMRMWNPDGTEDMCGNGLRCITHLAFARGHVTHTQFNIETRAGVRACEVLAENLIRVEMGNPQTELDAIPMAPANAGFAPIEYSLRVGGRLIPHVTSLSTGSTHSVIFVAELPDDQTFFSLSPQIEKHPWFPERTSVLWAKIEDGSRARIRIWERGVGETLACGTGACAVGVAAKLTGRAALPIEIQSAGGVLSIHWKPGKSIRMTGPAHTVFEGVAYL